MADATPKAVAKMEKLITRLLDLSKNNAQVYYQTSNSKTIEIIHGPLDTIFKVLVVFGQPCEFIPVYKGKQKRSTKKSIKTTEEKEDLTSDTNSESTLTSTDSSDTETAEISAPGTAHQTAIEKKRAKTQLNELITPIEDTTLATKLTNLMHKAAELQEERGIPSLYITFGILKWYETTGEAVTSPLLFVPVRLLRESVLSNFQISILNDDVVVNPTLRVKLKTQYNLILPEFGEEFDNFRLNSFFKEVKALIQDQDKWEIQSRIFIDMFLFEKISLYKDLDQNRKVLLSQPVIRAILEEKGYHEAKENLPTEEELGDGADPLSSFLILDSDSTQGEAIAYARKGTSLVIQGPPGTGKSQCITNIIAECLGANKKILFVAEKRAAIEVVKKRLEKSNLGEFCLEIHSQNANKLEILKQFEAAMETDPSVSKISESDFHELNLLREKLNHYVNEVNKPRGEIQRSIFDMMGRDLQLNAIPLLNFEFPEPFRINETKLVEIKNTLRNLEPYRTILEDYDRNPYIMSKITEFDENLKTILAKPLQSFVQTINQLQSGLSSLLEAFPVEGEKSENNTESSDSSNDSHPQKIIPTEWDEFIIKSKYWLKALAIFDKWMEFEELYREIVTKFVLDWDRPPYIWQSFKDILDLFPQVDKHNLKHQLQSQLDQIIFKIAQLKVEIEQFNVQSGLRPIKDFQDLKQYMDFFEIFKPAALTFVVDYYLTQFKTKYGGGTKTRGDEFKTDKTAIDSILNTSKSPPDYMALLTQIKTFQQWVGTPSKIEQFEPALSHLMKMHDEFEQILFLKQTLTPILNVPHFDIHEIQTILETYVVFSEEWLAKDHLDDLYEWTQIQKVRKQCTEWGIQGFFDQIKNRSFDNIGYETVFERAFYHYWIQEAIKSVPEVDNFKKDFREKLRQSFLEYDERILKLNQLRLREKLLKIRPASELNLSDSLLEQIGMIKREGKKKRNVKPLRAVFSEAQEYITMIKPCFMMSPMSVAEFLSVEKYGQFFDVIIFDEASQISPEDAIGAIMRGRQLIVVGDSQQLPPTIFFAAKSDELPEDLSLTSETMESILDECVGIGFREKMLRYHYRSRKEGLIAFSNHYFYKGQLLTFPDLSRVKQISSKMDATPSNELLPTYPMTAAAYLESLSPIDYRYMKNGIYDKRKNLEEAKAIANAIIEHYQNNQKFGANYTLGVIAFSQSQQEAIQSELDKVIKNTPDLQTLLVQSPEEALFIRNLENVQGDERDFIFFSIGYGKDPTGHLGYNFGPLNRSGGYRRLNVAVTRARYHVKIFCSFLPTEIHLDKVQADGLEKLVHYLEYGYTGVLTSSSASSGSKKSILDHPFEEGLKKALCEMGLTVDLFIGSSSFKIDLGIVDPKNPNKYILGIECDGGSYGAARTARDRERIRPQALQGLGWNYLHIWAPEWYYNRKSVLTLIESKLKSIGVILPSITTNP